MDYLYEKGTIIESKVPFQKGGEVSYSRTYGVLSNTGTGGSLNDPSWDIFTTCLPVGEFFAGAKLTKMGVTLVSKSSSGIRAMKVGGASKKALKSSVFFTKYLRNYGLNYSLGSKWFTVIGPNASTLGTFLGRNSVIIGSSLMLDGGRRIYNRLSY
jgi:hypothetical protein